MNGIQVKAYLLPDTFKVYTDSVSQVDEIRRFCLALNATKPGSYNTLIDKLQQAFTGALSDRGEVKTYWLDEEEELVGFSSDAELQYAVDIQTAVSASRPYEVKNSLFKVYVARKPKPEGNGCKWKNVQRGPRIHFGVVCDNCEGSIIGNRYKCSVCPDYDLCEECKGKKVHTEHLMNTITSPRHGLGARCQRRDEKRCRQTNPIEHVMKDLWSLPHLAASNVPLVNNPEQLKNFGENLKKFLDPFGIDVSYYVDNMTKTQEAGKSQHADVAEKKAEEEPVIEKEKDERSEAIVVDDEIEEVVVSKPLNSPNEGLEEMQARTSKAGEEECVASAPEKPEYEVAVVEAFDAAISALKSVVAANYESGTDQAVNGSMVDGFSLVEIDKELKIIRAIEQLNAMGYSDDGGWLTRLVAAKNGNINAVLDAITPSGPKK